MDSAAATAGRTRRVWRNTFFYVFSQAGAGIAGFFTSVLLANHLGTAGFGAYAFVFSATTLFTFAADLGLSFYAFREVSRSRAWLERNYLPMLMLKGAAGAVLLAVCIPAVRFVPLPAGTAGLLPLGFAVLLLNSLNGAAYSVFRAYERGGFQAVTVLFNRVTVLLFVALFLVPLGRDVRAVFVIMVIVGTAVFCINQLLVYRLNPSAFKGRTGFGVLLRAAAPFMLIMLFNQLYLHADMSMLAFMRGPDEAGIYAIPARLLTFGIMVPAAFVNALFPSLNRPEGPAGPDDAVARALRVLVLFALPAAACGWVLSDGFLAFFYRPGFARAALSMKIMSVTLGLMSLNWLLGHVLYARGRDRTMLKVVAAAVGINVLCNLPAIRLWGSAGAAAATLLTEVFIFTAELRLLRLGATAWRRIPWARAAAVTAVTAGAAILLASRIPFPAAAATAAALYLAGLAAARILKAGSRLTVSGGAA